MPAPQALSYTRAGLASLCAGLCAVVTLPVLPGPGAAFLCLFAAVCLALYRRGAPVAAAACALLGIGGSLLHAEARVAQRLPEDCLREPVVVSGVVASLPRRTVLAGGALRQRFELRVADISPVRCAGPRRVLLSFYGDAEILAGQGWSFQGRLRRPWGFQNPGSFNIQAWFAESGIDAVGSASAPLRRTALDSQYRYAHQRLRQWLAWRIRVAGLSTHGSAVIRAITVADKSGIDRSLWERLQAWGLNHLLVVSGLHVGMLAGTVLLLSRVLQRLGGHRCPSQPAALVLALLAAAAYTALAGFSVATLRALVMLAAVFVGLGLGRRGRAANALLPALALVLLANPLAAAGSGLWLSFTAVASLLWFACWQPAGRGPGAVLLAHLFLALVMLPLGALFFGGASLVSAPANLVAVPLFALWVVPLALLGVMLALLDSGADVLLWQWAVAPVDFWLQLAESMPWHYRYVAAQPLPVALAVLGVAALALPLSPWRRGLALLLLLPLVLPVHQEDSPVQVTVLDVGQGTAVVVRSGRRALLYDTGGGDPAGANVARSVVLPYLRSRGVAALEDLVISHGDQDHAAGLDSMLDALPVSRLWMGGTGPRPVAARPCRAGQGWHWPGGPRFRFLSPAASAGASSNDASCVLLVDTGRGRVLLAGDIAHGQELQLSRYWREALAAQVLLVGHHGSNTSTSQAWLNRVDPAVAIHSAGYGNRFGHPHPKVRARLSAQGVEQRTTWREGAIEVGFSAAGIPVLQSQRDNAKTWWK